MKEEPDCAVCGQTVPMDLGFAEIEVTHHRTSDRNKTRLYYCHPGCAEEAVGDWNQPA
jgi:hypothetical protein